MRNPESGIRIVIWTLAGLLLGWILLIAVRHPFKAGDNTFSAFYYAALALRTSGDLHAVRSYIYPPLMAWTLQPLTLLPPDVAWRVWIGFTFLLTSSSMLVGFRTVTRYFQIAVDEKTALTVMLAALLLSAGEARTEWSAAQCDGLVLDAFSFSLALLGSAPVAAGLVIAFAANIKYQTLILVPYLLWRRHFTAAFAAVFSAGIFGVIPAVTMGWTEALRAWISALGGMGQFAGVHLASSADVHNLTWSSSVSIPSAFARMLQSAGFSTHASLLAGAALAMIVLARCAAIYRTHGLPIAGKLSSTLAQLTVTEWCAVMISLLAFGPQTTRRHLFILMLMHLATATFLLLPGLDRRDKIRLGTALVVYQLALRLPPSGGWFNTAADAWKWVGGPSWGLLIILLALVRAGAASAGKKLAAPVASTICLEETQFTMPSSTAADARSNC